MEKKELAAKVKAALEAACEAPYSPARASGCGRAYVCVSGDRATVAAVKAACKPLKLMFLSKAYGTGGNVIYLGYDNADGRALGRSRVFAEVLCAHGISAYDEAVGD